MEREPDVITQLRTVNDSLDKKVKVLCELSMQLQEYSRALKEKSEQINQRLQSCVNSKRAA